VSAEPNRPGAPKSSLWIWFIPLGIAILLFGAVFFWVLGRTPDHGGEIGYRIPAETAPEMRDAARRRLQALDSRFEARVEQGLLILKIPGATPETSARVKQLFRTQGRLQLSAVAPVPLQEQFNRDKIVPVGYRVVENAERSRGAEYQAYGLQLLVQKHPVIEGRHIVQAEPRQEMTAGGSRWVTAFELDAEGTRLFDEAAVVLYNQRPPGLIAILLDDVPKSVPAVQSKEFHGRGQISGAKSEDDARDMAIILRTGALPVKLGEPEFERTYGEKKK
jgi:preprotein translocase subunit SecD